MGASAPVVCETVSLGLRGALAFRILAICSSFDAGRHLRCGKRPEHAGGGTSYSAMF